MVLIEKVWGALPLVLVLIDNLWKCFRLNSRYGIIGTPTVLLWVGGTAVSRMDEAPFSLKAFRDYLEKWTDLELEYLPAEETESGSTKVVSKFLNI